MSDNSEEKQVTIPPVRSDVPTVFVDGYHGVQLSNGVVRINFFENVHPADPVSGERRIVQRLAMGMPALLSVATALNGFIEQMHKDGLLDDFLGPYGEPPEGGQKNG